LSIITGTLFSGGHNGRPAKEWRYGRWKLS
jgi:hypothetical protein